MKTGADTSDMYQSEEPVCRFQVLSYEEVVRLDQVMEEVVPINGRGNFPTLEIKLKELTSVVQQTLKKDGVHVKDIRLNGGAANYVVAGEDHQAYNDLDLIFGVDLSNQKDLEKIKTCVLDSLLDFLPTGVCKDKISHCALKEAYVKKLVKVTHPEGDLWSLISLNNNRGKHVELKFVDSIRRQFEFSVDSFQVVLDSILVFYDFAQVAMNDNFYPTVVAESVYGEFSDALSHLKHKLIATRNPEEIRGGGLLKYCALLAKGYKPSDKKDIKTLERYMCSRFFIDFTALSQQKAKLDAYLANHFIGDEQDKCEYLAILYKVVDNSTVCLMGHERRQILSLIHHMACNIQFQQQQRAFNKHQQMAQFDMQVQNNSSVLPMPGAYLQPQVAYYPSYQPYYYYNHSPHHHGHSMPYQHQPGNWQQCS